MKVKGTGVRYEFDAQVTVKDDRIIFEAVSPLKYSKLDMIIFWQDISYMLCRDRKSRKLEVKRYSKAGKSIRFVLNSNQLFILEKITKQDVDLVFSKWESYKITNSISNHIAPKNGGADEIKKYYGLYNEGIITEDEFNVKKKELL